MAKAATAEPELVIQPEQAKGIGRDLEATMTGLVLRLGETTVTDLPSCQQAVDDRQAIGDAVKNVQKWFQPFKSAAHQLHKSLCDRENEILGPLLRVDGLIRESIAKYKTEQDRIRRAEESRVAEERRRQEEARLLEEAAVMEAQGDIVAAAAVVEEALAAPTPAVVLPDVMRQVQGLKFRTTWKWRFVNNDQQRALSLLPREYLCADEQKIGQVVRAMASATKIPGIEVYADEVPIR